MQDGASDHRSQPQSRTWIIGLIVVLSCLRFAHAHLLWADEDYHIAASLQALAGKVPYRDFWYDKPPLSALYYGLIDAHWGWPLRLLDAIYILACCFLCFRIARLWWTDVEAYTAAVLFAFYTTFYLPSTVIPFAADAVMILPHLAAICFAARRYAFWAGLFAGIAFLANAKGLFVLLVCAIWIWPAWILLAVGFAIPAGIGAATLYVLGAWAGYVEQVWRWGVIYARGSPVVHPFKIGVERTADWLGFHSALALGSVFGFTKGSQNERWKLGSWIALSFAAACLGTRFAPHYFLQLLPAMVIAGARGLVLLYREHRRCAATAITLCLLVPFIRFGPRYVSLAYEDATGRRPTWIDVNLDLDSQDVAKQINALAHRGDTLFVWGYRPDIYVYTRLVPPGLFWDSQPLTGVPADRHLQAVDAIYSGPAAANRAELIRTHPTWIVDGLGLLNPKLRPQTYLEVNRWISGYQEVSRTRMSVIYRKISIP